MTIHQAFNLALQHHHAGRLAEAEAIYRQILTAEPRHAEALHHLGIVKHQTGRYDLAAERIRKTLVLNPDNAHAHSNLGEAYRALGQLDAAVEAYRRALALKPDFPAAHGNLGMALACQGKLDEAVAEYRKALQLRSDQPDTHNHLGIALKEQGRLEEAVASYRRALELRPGHTEAHNNLGAAFADMGCAEEAVASYRRALELRPDLPVVHTNMGIALREQGRLEEAVAAFRTALKLRPDCPDAHNELGIALAGLGRLGEAFAEYQCSLRLLPNSPRVWNNLGKLRSDQGRLDEAVAAFSRALQLKPDMPEAHCNLGNALGGLAQTDAAIACFRRVIELTPKHPLAYSNLICTLHFHPGADNRMIRREQRQWNRRFGDPVKRFILPHTNDRNPERRLRIGYVSPDFRDHVVGRNVLPLLERHDREQFEVLCYSEAVGTDWLTERFRGLAAGWRNTVGVSDARMADLIREDRVDIVVDLAQHLAGNRLPVFAREPAPVQVSFAGYPESTGLEAIRHRISDRYLEAGSVDDGTKRTEQVCLLASFWCYDPCGTKLKINPLPSTKSGTVTFGYLGSFGKTNDPVLKLWAGVLRAVKDSRLLLLSPTGGRRERTLEMLRNEGVEAHRLEFVEFRPRRDYLEQYHRVDICLDTFPYNGHTTSLDALWMGVPVVTLAGRTPVSRAGLSQLSNIGLPELVAHTEDEYVKIAAELAGDLPRLGRLRATLRTRMEASVLMDASRFTRDIEAAYRAMWQHWCGKKQTAI